MVCLSRAQYRVATRYSRQTDDRGRLDALISKFQQVDSDRNGVHKPVLCGWRRFNADGQIFLQFDTYGSDERQIPNKVSQSIQLDREAAASLLKLIRDTFGGL
jgi:hypothetical protein